MKLRRATIAVGVVDAVAWALIAFAAFVSTSDAATKGLDEAAGLIVTTLFAVTGAPALALAFLRRAPTTALILALAFPAVLAAAFLATMMAFA